MKDTYKSITKASPEVLFKDRNSKFFGYAYPVKTEDEVNEILEDLKKQHHKARHWCYAWQFGKEEEQQRYRANDDGEPSNSAGMPIYGQIQSFEVTNILIVVVRYFGGVKLGVGGLINAYKTAAQMALESSEIITRTIDEIFVIQFDYPEMNKVMQVIKQQNLNVIDQKLELDCRIFISVRKNEAEEIFTKFDNTYKVKISRLEN
ncbi:MAG: YigZ family protein [Bacteroidota bacterium]|uniref:Protein co-occurring with transport systems n=1 Tax=Christiangramia flava JLT2011 TaxID=1229726 RepID=A0A1L7I267_9FLAO|nr:YigZ family protein [Christiangramia flava]APU67162.1 protein co-occurring with transport systems [Christiangramia flava JLT2011]MEE2771067.1 YigZ family protein [Bacteroidota bacterium]OSS38066.1 protein co-occurring with transport system [Christiangramia flava JLT2011]